MLTDYRKVCPSNTQNNILGEGKRNRNPFTTVSSKSNRTHAYDSPFWQMVSSLFPQIIMHQTSFFLGTCKVADHWISME